MNSNQLKLYTLILSALILLGGCSSAVRFSSGGDKHETSSGTKKQKSVPAEKGAKFYGKASYYGDEFNGRKTANGDIFDNDELTAAHKTLPFGTVLQVRNIKNNKTVNVIVNDRGPFVEGRIIDLSKAAAKQLDMIRQGVAEVEITVIE